MSAFLYISIILLWGSTWFAIKNQVGVVPVEISLIYRFSIALPILFIIMLFAKAPFRFSFKQHGVMALLGCLLFSTNFYFIYKASAFLTSGITAIILSTSIIMIMLNNVIFLKKPINKNMFAGSIVGLVGLACIFWPELEAFSLTDNACLGLMLALTGTYCFAWANHVSMWCSKLSIPLLSSTFYGMLYGILLLNIVCLFSHHHYAFDTSIRYVISLMYLAVPGSVLGFLTYLSLLERVGPEKAVYTTLFFPLVALIVSTFFEDFTWIKSDFVGVAMVVLGNTLVLLKPKKSPLAEAMPK